jgi:hypothetical protein
MPKLAPGRAGERSQTHLSGKVGAVRARYDSGAAPASDDTHSLRPTSLEGLSSGSDPAAALRAAEAAASAAALAGWAAGERLGEDGAGRARAAALLAATSVPRVPRMRVASGRGGGEEGACAGSARTDAERGLVCQWLVTSGIPFKCSGCCGRGLVAGSAWPTSMGGLQSMDAAPAASSRRRCSSSAASTMDNADCGHMPQNVK